MDSGYLRNPIHIVLYLSVEAAILSGIIYALRAGVKQLVKESAHKASGHVLPLCLITLCALAIFIRDPYSASESKVSDAVEYSVAAQRFATEDGFTIPLGSVPQPPRYQPWFSLFFLAPAYLLGGVDLGAAHFPVAFFAVLGIVGAYILGALICGVGGGLLGAMFLLSSSTYRYFSNETLSDVPCSVLSLLACIVFVREGKRSASLSPGAWLAFGILIATASALRPTSLVFIIPGVVFVLSKLGRGHSFASLAAVLVPPLITILACACYNLMTFGSPLRSGYHYWTAVPYDYPNLTFNTSYLITNIKSLWDSNLIVQPLFAALIICFMARSQNKSCAGMARFDAGVVRRTLLYTVLPLPVFLIFYLLYFYQSPRFYLPFQPLFFAMLAGMLAGFIPLKYRSRKGVAILVTAILVLSLAYRFSYSGPLPLTRLSADRISKKTGDNALVISALNPVYLEHLISRGNTRRVMPVSRTVEFASKLMVRRKIAGPSPAPKDAFDHRAAGLLNAGARDAVPYVAVENPELVHEAIDSGVPVYIYSRFMEPADFKTLETLFHLEEVESFLYEVWKRK